MILSNYFKDLDLALFEVDFCDLRIEWNRSTSIPVSDHANEPDA